MFSQGGAVDGVVRKMSKFEMELQALLDEGYSREGATSYLLHRYEKEATDEVARRHEDEEKSAGKDENNIPTLRSLCARMLQNPVSIHDKLVLWQSGHFDRVVDVDILGDDEEFLAFRNRLSTDLRAAFPAILENYKGDEELIRNILGPEYFDSFKKTMEESALAKKTIKAYRSGSILEREMQGLTEAEQEMATKQGIYPYRVLKAGVKWPDGIDITKRETYLGDIEFEEVFGMSKEAYQSMRKHKRDLLKKEKNLF